MRAQRYRSEGFEIQTHVRDGRDPAVVLLHGAGGHGLAWEPILDAFGDRQLILVDLPGHGDSPSSDDWSLERLARDLVRVVGQEHAGPLVWGGHSWGGKTAALVAALAPAAVRALVLIDPSPASPVPITPEDFVASALDSELGPWSSLDDASAAVRALPQYTHWTPALRRSFERGVVQRPDGSVAARVRRDDLLAITAATLNHDDSATIGTLSVPTLLVLAEQSMFWQEPTNVAVLGNLPNVTTTTLAGHHWLHYEPPQPLIATLRPWLDEVAA